jgi:2-polyprenyl-3-methyl-5-hydroxy-6-metoxy-1,4-benzoquinol methylase
MRKLIKSIYRLSFKKIFPTTGEIIESILRKELKDCKSVLDLGCGPSSPLKYLKKEPRLTLYSVGVDIFEPYILKNLEENKIHSEYINTDIFKIDFPANSFDCILLIDVIEHFEKTDFQNFLPKLEKIANKIIIITPNGFIEQKTYDNNQNQIHLSGWTQKEMKKLGFKCNGLSGLKFLRGQEWEPKIKPAFIGDIISNITQKITWNIPGLAYHLVCIKNNKQI